MLPTITEIEALHRKYAPDDAVFTLVWTHCRIVRDIALQLLEAKPQPGIDAQLVEAGCLLHDIGTYKLYKDGSFDRSRYITHGIEGDALLGDEGYDERLRRIASHHTGTGLTKQDIIAQSLPLPHEDFMAETQEERLVMYADKFHSKAPRFNSYAAYSQTIRGFGAANLRRFEDLADEFGIPNLDTLAKVYEQPIV